jgi:N utilization substance protein B
VSAPSRDSGEVRVAKLAGKRRMAREMAVQMLYQIEVGRSPLSEVFAAYDVVDFLKQGGGGDATNLERTLPGVAVDRLDEAKRAFEYACGLVAGTSERIGEIDALIRAQAENWRLERMPTVDRNILRLAVFELLAETDVPPLVVLDEAVELAKRFGTAESPAFVNGVLDRIASGLGRAADGPAPADDDRNDDGSDAPA